MAGTDTFDILLQFHQTAIQDLQLRVLNTSPFTNMWVKSPFTRRIEQPLPPLEIKAYWNKPQVTIYNGCIELTTELNGGARQIASGRILTLDGAVSARQKVTVAVDSSKRPYICVETPDPLHLNLYQLKVSYEGSKWPPFLANLDPAKEATLLRPVLATQLFEPLACLPLTYMPSSLPVASPAITDAISIAHALPSILPAPESVVLGLMFDSTFKAQPIFTNLLPTKSGYNAAVGISTQGLNVLLAHLCKKGKATGLLLHSHLGQTTWCWETLTVTLQQQVIQLTGMLVQQGAKTQVQAEMQCQLVTNGCLQCTLLSSNTNAILSETVLASWTEVMKMFLRSRATNQQDKNPHDSERLFQCFSVPGSNQMVETVAQELLIVDEQLIIYYTIPLSPKGFQLELPPPEPTVIITQPSIPQQTAPGAPVVIELDVQITKDSTPPYDYAWTSDLLPSPSPQFGPKLTLSSVPAAVLAGTEPQTLTIAHLKVIDMFGQVANTQAPAKYIPYSRQQQKQQKTTKTSRDAGSAAGFVGTAFAILVVIALVASILIPQWTHSQNGSISNSPTTSGPTLQGSVNVAPATVNLSSEGTLDWVHWGYLASDNTSSPFIGNPVQLDCQTNSHCLNRKQNSTLQISDFTPVGSFNTSKLPYRLYVRGALTHFSWDDGSPVPSVADARTQVYIAGAGNGSQVQIPADQTTHTFRLYIGVWNSQVKCTASLSDGSAPDYINTSLTTTSSNYVLTFTYRAASPNQTLLVTLTILTDYGGANTSLSAATLQ